MFGWHCLQSEVRLTIIFLLLLISSQNASNASKMKHLPQNEAATKQISSKNKVDIHRLYYAYRDRVKEGGDELKLGTGPIAESTAVAEEENEDSLVKSRAPNVSRGVIDKSEKTALIGKEIAENSKDAKKTQLMSSTGNCDAPDEHHMGDVKCVPKPKTKIVENKHKVLEKLKIKEPDLKGMVILKMDSPSKEKVNPSNSLGKSDGNYEALDSAERCIAELNSIYKEFISAWKKPQSDSKKPNLIVVTPVRLNALNELMNVVENLKQPNTMNDFVKAINDEMSRESADITSFDKLNNNIAKANPMKVERATCIFKRMSNDRNVGKISDLKTGGLYEQYKSKLDEILKANHSPNKLNAKDLINSFRNDMPQCHCDAKKHLTLDSEGNKIFNGQSQCHCEASRYALGGDLSKLSNAVVQCHCDDMKNARLVDPKTGKDNDYLEALNGCMKSAKEKSTNGGPKPYYISNSKQRQMVWNDIPLMRSGQTNATQTVVKGIGKAITNSEENRQATVKINNLDAKSEVPIISTLQRNVTNSPTFNKNQKQLQHLLKVLQAKHRSSNTKRSFKRALVDYTERIGNPLGNVGFPQVLVNQVGQVGTGQQAGSGMIDNIAKQLNVSPMEMAQRIAASSNSLAPPSYPWQSNSARPSDTNAQVHKQLTRLHRRIHKINRERQT